VRESNTYGGGDHDPGELQPHHLTSLTGGTVTWRVARSLDVLLGQLNAKAPNRSKASDGSIGDAAHQTRDSDHNPWYGPGIVTARDFTHDPAGGLDGQWLADTLVHWRDPRIKYVIWNRRILDTRPLLDPWTWQPYDGTNPHTHHVHLSVMDNPTCDDTRAWTLAAPVTPPAPLTLRYGMRHPDVLRLQSILTTRYPAYAKWSPCTDYFGDKTLAAVKEFQRRSGLAVDGVVGAMTRKALGM